MFRRIVEKILSISLKALARSFGGAIGKYFPFLEKYVFLCSFLLFFKNLTLQSFALFLAAEPERKNCF